MLELRRAVRLLAVGLVACGSGTAAAQNYPNKVIRIVTAGVGGGLDLAARLIAREIAEPLGQQVIVDNRSNSVVPIEIVSKAPPDGYTLLLFGPPLWIGPFLQKVSYDPIKDFAPVTLAVRSPSLLVVTPALPANSVSELIALAKAKPGSLNYASNAVGASSHLAAELFNAMAGIRMVRVPYKTNAVLVGELIAGQVQVTFGTAGTVGAHLKSGKLRGLAVTSAEPSALFPGMPTVAASGLPGYESTSMYGIFAPAKTPAALIQRLNQEIVLALNKPDLKEQFLSTGVETVGSSPKELDVKIKSEMARMEKVIKSAGIHLD